MRRLASFESVQPRDITQEILASEEGLDLLTVAASNAVRAILTKMPGFALREPLPRLVTRAHPSLDNVFAELLVRSCWRPTFPPPAYEERLIFGSAAELSPVLNTGLAGSVLIGIGGLSARTDVIAIYDEHAVAGRRRRDSASQVAWDALLPNQTVHDAPGGVSAVLREINAIDSSGGSSYDHLGSISKGLHLTRFPSPAFQSIPIAPEWKRAVLGGALAAVCCYADEGAASNDQAAAESLASEWQRHVAARGSNNGANGLPAVSADAIDQAVRRTVKRQTLVVDGVPSRLTLRRVVLALQHCWERAAAELIASILLEAVLQTQMGFERSWNATCSVSDAGGGVEFIYYEVRPEDVLPHRGILSRLGRHHKTGLLVVRNGHAGTVAAFPTSLLPAPVWDRFVASLLEREGDGTWYVPTGDDGRRSKFILNGTEWNVDRAPTSLGVSDLLQLLRGIVAKTNIAIPIAEAKRFNPIRRSEET
jgi:hypothetical protein